MKSLISIIAVILVVIMALGAISSLTESVGSGAGGGSSTTTASSVDGGGNVNSDGSVTVDGKLTVFTGGSGNYMGKASDVATYSYGDCFDYTSEEENNRIYMGKIINSITDEALICFAFSGLEVGKTYLIHCSFYDLSFDIDELYYRFNSGGFKSFTPLLNEIDECCLLFTAEGTDFQLGVCHFPESPSDVTFDVYADALNESVVFSLYEVTE